VKTANTRWHDGAVTPADRAAALGFKGATIWFTGLPASGKSTLAVEIEALLIGAGRPALRLDGIDHRLDLEALERAPAGELALNDLARVRLRLGEPLAADAYADSRATGAFILIDEATNDTVAAGMVEV
jgi:sulfate adenylyltransferase subunit 1 (EFTu-like GTPase family)